MIQAVQRPEQPLVSQTLGAGTDREGAEGAVPRTSLPVLRPYTAEPAVRSELEELLRVQVLEPAATIDRHLPVFGITHPLTEPELVRSEEFGTWFFVNGFEDPTIETFGAQPIPAKIRQELRDLANTGLPLNRIWVAHQVPDDWPEEAPLPQLVPDQPRIRRADESLIKFSDAFAQGLGLLAGAVAVGLAAGAAVAVAGAATVGLDPLILGGIDHPTQPATIWVVLAQWEWPQE